MTARQQDPKPRRIALLIGNAQNSDERLAPLVVPAADVRTPAAVLRDPAVCGVEELRSTRKARKMVGRS